MIAGGLTVEEPMGAGHAILRLILLLSLSRNRSLCWLHYIIKNVMWVVAMTLLCSLDFAKPRVR